MLAQKLLSMGGPYGYLGAAAISAGSMTLGSLSNYYGQHYSTPYSERRGAKIGDILYDNFGSPTLAVEQAINSLESSSMNERSGANIVTAFSKSGTQLGGQGVRSDWTSEPSSAELHEGTEPIRGSSLMSFALPSFALPSFAPPFASKSLLRCSSGGRSKTICWSMSFFFFFQFFMSTI